MKKSGYWVIVTVAFLSITSYSEAAGDKKPYAKEAVELYNKAEHLHELGFLSQAISNYKAAIAADGRMEEAWSNLGVIYYAQKNFAAASNAFQKAIQLNPNQAANFSYYARVLDAMGKSEEAAKARLHAQGLEHNRALTSPQTKPSDSSKEEVQQFLKGKTKTIHGLDVPQAYEDD